MSSSRRKFQISREWRIAGAGLIFLALLPLLIGHEAYLIHIFIMCFIFSVFAASWDLVGGYMGLINFGHAAFFGMGAYTSALLSLNVGISPWIALFLAGVASMAFGAFNGVVSLRFRNRIYFVMCTLGFAETARMICRNWVSLTRGVLGLWGYPTFPGISTRVDYYYLALVFMGASLFIMHMLAEHTRLGLIFRSIKDDEVLTEHLGINVAKYKVLCFMISTFFAGLTGSMYAHHILLLTPEDVLASTVTVLAIGMVVIGGIRTIVGPVIGAFITVIMSEVLRMYVGIIYNLVAFGFLIMVFAIFIPGGIMGWIRRRIA